MSESRPRVLLIDDNPDFGGHQVMSAYALEGMLRFGEWEVFAMYHPKNQKNFLRWQACLADVSEGRLSLEVAPTWTAKFQAIRRLFQGDEVKALEKRVREVAPDVVLVIQGNIEQGCGVFRLKGRVSCPVVSYIPVPHKHAEMGAKLGRLRDLTCRGLYAEPDGFITISDTLGQMLRDYGATGRIQIVENGIPLERFRNLPSKAAARETLGLPESGFIWGQVGRTEFMQKGQDFALELFRRRASSNEGEYLAFLGSGPDSDALAARANEDDRVFCLPWAEDPSLFYAAIDGLIMPSRYEGVPLAMIEALANGIPVAATDRDGMRDWLPSCWRFNFRDLEGGLRALESVRGADVSRLDALRERVWSMHSVEAFQRSFNSALKEWS